jgi:mannosyl-oligosaccharide alpha-1,2-mannosidase
MLGGNKNQYHIFFRPMIPDRNREVLIAGTTRKTLYGDGSFKLDPEGQHLTCFLGGLFGIASRIFERPEDLVVAKKLVDGCVWAYEASPNGIMPEILRTWPCPKAKDCPWDEEEYFKGVVTHGPSVDSAIKPKGNAELAKQFIARNGLPQGFTDVRDTRYILR